MGTIKVKKQDNYSVLHNGFINNEKLSWQARGMLAYLLSKPDDWQVMTADLIKQSPAGRDATQSIINELKQHGYMERKECRDKNQKIYYETTVYESPGDTGAVNGFSVNGSSVNGKPVLLLSTDLPNTELTNTEGTQEPDGIGKFVQEVIDTWNSSLQELPDLNLTDKTTIRMKDKLVLPNKRNGKMTKYEKDIRGKLRDLYKDEDFREEWKEALLTALDTPGMISRSWFKLHWFIGTGKNGNQPGYVRCLIREFAWADKEVVNTPRFNQPIEHVPGNPGF